MTRKRSPKRWSVHFRIAAVDPGRWSGRARDLHRAACALGGLHAEAVRRLSDGTTERAVPGAFEHIGSGQVFLMLAGMAIESLTKAIIVAKERPARPMATGTIPKWMRTHNLPRLLERAGVLVADVDEADLINRMTLAITWRARYPVPVSEVDMDPGRRMWSDDLEAFKRLFDRLEDEAATSWLDYIEHGAGTGEAKGEA